MVKRLGISAPAPPIVGLRNLAEGEEHDLWGPSHPEAGELRNKALEILSKADPERAAIVAMSFAVRTMPYLLGPCEWRCWPKNSGPSRSKEQ